MGFKDSFLEDLETTFFDMDGFASEHTIDGTSMTVVLVETAFKNVKMGNGSGRQTVNPKESAVNKSGTIIFLKEKDVKRKFTVNSMVNLDGKNLFVYDVKYYSGVYKLTVGTYRI